MADVYIVISEFLRWVHGNDPRNSHIPNDTFEQELLSNLGSFLQDAIILNQSLAIYQSNWQVFCVALSQSHFDSATSQLNWMIDQTPEIDEKVDAFTRKIAQITTATIELDRKMKILMAANEKRRDAARAQMADIDAQISNLRQQMAASANAAEQGAIQKRIQLWLIARMEHEPQLAFATDFERGEYPAVGLMQKFQAFEVAFSPERNAFYRVTQPLHNLFDQLSVLGSSEPHGPVWQAYLSQARDDFDDFVRFNSTFDALAAGQS